AAQTTRVFSLEVAYIGWNGALTSVQVVALGAYLICPKPLATLAFIEPDCPVLRSLITTSKPSAVSCMDTVTVSPECIIRSLLGSGVKVAPFASSGLAGPVAFPLRVMNAKLTGSTPALLRQSALLMPPAPAMFRFSVNESMLRAAHHLVGSQLSP